MESKLYRQLSLPTELHLRHLSVKVVLTKLTNYLLEASVAGIIRVNIIHGRSGRDFRKATHHHLKENSLVEGFEYPAPPAEGGSGAIVVRLRRVSNELETLEFITAPQVATRNGTKYVNGIFQIMAL
jgi:DNA-nicking Smr family endonuclease